MRAGVVLSDLDRKRAVRALRNQGIPMAMGGRPSALADACARALGTQRPQNDADRVALIRRYAGDWQPVGMAPLEPLKQSAAMQDALARCTEYSSMPSWWDRQRGR